MKAYFYGPAVRVQSENPIDDSILRDADLPRSPGLLSDGSLAVDFTTAEALEYKRNPMVSDLIQEAIQMLWARHLMGVTEAAEKRAQP